MSAFYTHRPYLQKELDDLMSKALYHPVHILELGVGDGSSELLHNFAQKHNNASVLGLETDRSWASNTKDRYKLPNYNIQYIPSWKDVYCTIPDQFYDLIFIDQSPWEARIEALEYFSSKDSFSTAILHDYDYYNPNDYKYSYDENSFFRSYNKNYILQGFFEELPPTLVFKRK